MKKVLLGMLITALSGSAFGASFSYTLTEVISGSSNGESGGVLSKSVDYTITDAGIISNTLYRFC